MSASFLQLRASGLWVLTTPSALAPLPIYTAGAAPGGGIVWGAAVAVPVAAGPVSTTLIAANPLRKALSIWSPTGNGAMAIDLTGGVATLATGRPVVAGAAALDFLGAYSPVGAVTFIGTAGQSLVVQEGT